MRRRTTPKIFNTTPPPILYNTFIGKAGQTYNTAALLVSKLTTIVESDIQNFEVDGDGNIRCFIGVNYGVGPGAFRNLTGFLPANGITYFIDVENKVTACRGSSFRGQASFTHLKVRNWVLTNSDGEQLNGSGNTINQAYYPLLVRVNKETVFTNCKRVYVPMVTNINNDTNSIRCANNGFIYANPSLKTSGSGGTIEPILQWNITNRSATIVFVLDTTPPDAITDLSVSDIATTTAKLNFTPPSSVNGIGYYNVWLDDGTNNPIKMFMPNQEITASGDTIIGLTTGTTYKVKVKAYSGYGTEADLYSNEQTFTTL